MAKLCVHQRTSAFEENLEECGFYELVLLLVFDIHALHVTIAHVPDASMRRIFNRDRILVEVADTIPTFLL